MENGDRRATHHSNPGYDFNFKGVCVKVICVMCVLRVICENCDTIQESVNNQHAGWHILHDFMMHGMEMLIGDSGQQEEKKKKKKKKKKGNTKHDMHFHAV